MGSSCKTIGIDGMIIGGAGLIIGVLAPAPNLVIMSLPFFALGVVFCLIYLFRYKMDPKETKST